MALRTIDWRGKQKKKRGGTVCVCVPFARQRVGKCATWGLVYERTRRRFQIAEFRTPETLGCLHVGVLTFSPRWVVRYAPRNTAPL